MPHTDYEIRWQNFRGFPDTGWLRLRPLTILLGPNGAGKTSIIAPFLLLNQTVSSRDAGTPLITRGPLFDAGAYKDLVFDHDTRRDIRFGIRFHTHDPDPEEELRGLGAYPPGEIDLTFGLSDDSPTPILKSYKAYDIYKREYLHRSRLQSGRYSVRGEVFKGLSPKERKALARSKPVNYLFTPTRDIYEIHDPKDRERTEPAPFSEDFVLYLNIVSVVFTEIRRFFDQLSYIGPLRDKPHRYYETLDEEPRSVGPAGERSANLLRRRITRLREPLEAWIKKFELGDSIEVREITEDLFIVEFLSEKYRTNIADAGFGASQVLPLVIQAVAAEKGGLTIAEQPEIHLNPRLQSILGDLLVSMAKNDRGVLVETHSEHLLLRIRRLIASEKISCEDVALYFVEKTHGKSTIREVPIKANGHIASEDWPRGFFGDSLKESLALAHAQRDDQAASGSC